MRSLIVAGCALLLPLGAARAQGQADPVTGATPAPAEVLPAATVADSPANKIQFGVAFLPILWGSVVTGPSAQNTSSDLDPAYGIGLCFGYEILRGLSVGVTPQAIFHMSAKDSAGYTVIDSEKEYDLMARIAYAHAVLPKLDVFAEIFPGYSFVTFDKIVVGSKAPRARGIVLGGGVGAALAITDRLFASGSVGYQMGFQASHGITLQNVETRFLRIALGGGVKL